MACEDCNCGKAELEKAQCGIPLKAKIAHPIILGIALGGGLAILVLLLVKYL